MALKFGSEVTENGTIRKLGYGFLFAFHCNYGSIFYHFRDKARYWQKNRIFFILPGGFPSEYCQFATPFGTEKLWCRYQQQHYPVVKKKVIFSSFDRILACDKQTDGHLQQASRENPNAKSSSRPCVPVGFRYSNTVFPGPGFPSTSIMQMARFSIAYFICQLQCCPLTNQIKFRLIG